jgi:hypothetical protein
MATGTISSGTGISVTAGQKVIGTGLTITNTGVTSLGSVTGAIATGTITCAGTASCGAGSYVLGSNLTITGAGSASGLGTSSPWTVGNLAYVSSSGAVSSVGTSTLSATSPLTGSFTQVGSGGALGIQVANTSQGGYLSNTDWNTFNNKWDLASSTITVAHGGTGAVTLTGCLTGNGTGAITGSGTCNTSNATVSSVGLSAPTGLTVSNSPVTTSGTIGLALTAGYVIPLTASTTSWNNSLASTTALNGVSPITYNGSTGAIGCSTCNTTASNVINVTNSDGTLTISPTTGNVVGSIALGHANTWTGGQTFTNATTTSLAITGITNSFLAVNANGSVIATTTGGGTNYWTSAGGNIYNNTGTYVGIGTTSPATKLDVNGDITDENVKSAACLATDSTGKIVSTTCGTGTGGLATSSPWTVGNLATVVSNSAVSSVATTSVTCTGSTSCSPFTVIGTSPITINSTGGAGGAGGTWSTTTSTVGGELLNYSNNTTDIVVVGSSATSTAKFFVDPNIGQAVLNGGGAGTSTISVGSSSHGGCVQTWDAVNAQYDKSWWVGGIMYVDIGTCTP